MYRENVAGTKSQRPSNTQENAAGTCFRDMLQEHDLTCELTAWQVKLRANGFNIHWILLKSNVKTVCHHLETVLKLFELKLNQC